MAWWPTLACFWSALPLMTEDGPPDSRLVKILEFLNWLVEEFKPLVYYVMMALIWAGIAQGKGRSGLVWFVLALMFPVLSWLAILLLPARR